MSRIHDNENPIDTAVQLQCNNQLPPHQYWQCQHIEELQTLFKLVDPSILHKHNSDHHAAYMTVSTAVSNLIHVLHQEHGRRNHASKLGSRALHRHGTTLHKKNVLNGRTPKVFSCRSPVHEAHTTRMTWPEACMTVLLTSFTVGRALGPRTAASYLSAVKKYFENQGVDTTFFKHSQYIRNTKQRPNTGISSTNQ